jgi:hypothetical protein
MFFAAPPIAKEALALTTEDRADLADRLVQSLDAGGDHVWRGQRKLEALKRLDEVRSGVVRLVPERAAMHELRCKFGAFRRVV